MGISKLVTSGVFWGGLDKVICQLGSLYVLIYLARILEPEDFGIVGIVAVFIGFSQVFIDSGFSQALIQKNQDTSEDDYSTVFVSNILIAFFIYALFFFISDYIAIFFNEPAIDKLVEVLMVILIFNALSIVPLAKLKIKIDLKTIAKVNIISMLASSFIALYLVNNHFGYWSLACLYLSKAVFTSFLLFFYSKWVPRLMFSYRSFKPIFDYGSKLLISGVIAEVFMRIHVLVVGKYFGTLSAGNYHQAFTYTNLLSSLFSSIAQNITFPLMSSIKKDKHKLIIFYENSLSILSYIAIPLFFGFASIANEFVIIFLGDKWVQITPLLIAFSFSRICILLNTVNIGTINAIGRSDVTLKLDVIKIPIIVTSLLIALPYGVLAIAYSQLFNAVVALIINTYYSAKFLNFGILKQIKLLLPIFLASICMSIIVNSINFESIILQFFIKIVIGITSYVILSYLFKLKPFSLILNAIKPFRSKDKIQQ